MSLEEGKSAPALKLPSTEGKEIAISDYKGKKHVVLYFYPKDNTPGCTQESCDFRDAYKQMEKQDAVILGISPDSLSSHQKFREKFGFPFPLLSDESKETLIKYGVWKEKSLYGRKYMGVERTTVIIDKSGKIRRIFSKVKVNGHAGEVLETLKSLQ